MSENAQQVTQDAATEAAQNVVDTVTSYEYSGDREQIAEQLDEGLQQAGVEVDGAERERLVGAIDGLKQDEDAGTPTVGQATPSQD